MTARITKLTVCFLLSLHCLGQKVKKKSANRSFAVLAYYSGNETQIDQYDASKLTHIIYSFCHLKGNELYVGNGEPIVRKLVSLKKQQPGLKILLSLGGWGGCKTCSDVFSTAAGRDEFAKSVREWTLKLGTDGIDLDWEYPAYEGPPGHPWKQADRPNFTALVKSLRTALGNNYEISFAAGGFMDCLQKSIDWKLVMPMVNRVNIMSYDLVNGNSTQTGHHTPLYSTPTSPESVDKAVRYLGSLGIPMNKIVIGAAFYARVFEVKDTANKGFSQPAAFKDFIGYRSFPKVLSTENGYATYYDETAKASYSWNADKKLFATYDDSTSVSLKTRYAIQKGLNGIMFWELTLDQPKEGLLEALDKARQAAYK